MEINLEINKKSACPLSAKFLKKVAESALRHSRYFSLNSKKVTISLALVPEKEIRRINRRYRGQDAATDVLSIANYERKKDLLEEKKAEIFLGELIICCGYIEKSVKKSGASFKEEVARALSHGVLHLLGFRHGKEMFSVQDEVSRAIFKKSNGKNKKKLKMRAKRHNLRD